MVIEDMWKEFLRKTKLNLDPDSQDYSQRRLAFYGGVAETYLAINTVNEQLGEFFAEEGKLYDKDSS
tara:strand:+ start:512 stop:712 length:201 start_codon:yes stop_codon:yes gene_type:complete